MEKGLLIAVSGFSGAGKGTLMQLLTEKYPEDYALSVSATTRAPREGEEEGVSYFFKTKDEFEQLIREDALIEYARYVDNYYGTPRSFVEERQAAGKDVLLEIEVQGALQVKEKFPDAVLIFITAPDIEELESRLRGRNTEDEASIQKRIARAKEEVHFVENYDYLLVNDVLENAAEEIRGIIAAEHWRVKHKNGLLKQLQEELGGR